MITIKSKREIELMKEAARINVLAHKEAEKHLKAGITTNELNNIIHKYVTSHDAYPSCLGYEGFPKATCISVNDEVVHGIPDNRVLKNGDIVKIDFTVRKDGYESDMARTYIIGDVEDDILDLVNNTKKAYEAALSVTKPGNRVGDISNAVEEYAHAHGLSVVEELVGHGVGTSIHEDPEVPNYGVKGRGPLLKEGMVIAIEPMLNLGSKEVYLSDNDWTVITQDGSYSAHYENTVLITSDGYEELTGD